MTTVLLLRKFRKNNKLTNRDLDKIMTSRFISKSRFRTKNEKIKAINDSIKRKPHNIAKEKKIEYIVKFNDSSKRGASRIRKTTGHVMVSSRNTKKEIKQIIEDSILDYFHSFNLSFHKSVSMGELEADTEYISVNSVKTHGGGKALTGNIGGMKLNDVIFNKLNLNLKSNNDKININCVKHYIDQVFSKVEGSKKFVKYVKNLQNITVDTLYGAFKTNNKDIKCYTQDLKLYKQWDSKKNRKTLYCIVSNEHIYITTKKEINALYKIKKDKLIINNIVHKKDIGVFVQEEIKNNQILKWQVQPSEDDEYHEISRALIGDTLYVLDESIVDKYDAIKKVCGFFPTPFNFSGNDIFTFLAHKNKLYSTFTQELDKPFGAYYNDPSINGNDTYPLLGVDKNLSFAHALSSLEYLPILDSMIQILPYENQKINDNNFYNVSEVKKNRYCMLSKGWQSGWSLKCVKNINDYVVISEYLRPQLKRNPYKEIISDLIKNDRDLAKDIINPFVGNMKRDDRTSTFMYEHLTNSEEEANTIFENPISLLNGMYCNEIFIESKNKFSENLKPISIMVSDYARYTVSRKINQLENLDKNVKIRAIKTDSIHFYSEKIVLENLNLNNKLSGWKKEIINLSGIIKKDNNNIPKSKKKIKKRTYNKIKKKEWSKLLEKNSLFDCFAGSGKTTACLENIIPDIQENNKTFIVLSTKHSALGDYYNQKLNAKVIHYFTFNPKFKNLFRSFDYVIFDECGLLEPSHFEFIHNNLGKNTKLIMFGDKCQLMPIGTPRTQKVSQLEFKCIKNLFDICIEMTDNFRNNYTVDDYRNMQNLTFDMTPYEKKLINTYGRLNICVFKKSRKIINDIIIKKRGWTDKFDNMFVKKNGMLIADFKNLKQYPKFKELGIYNSQFLKIVDYTDDIITVKDKNKKNYGIDIKLFHNNFDYGYCITSFKSQGMSIPYNDIGIFDWDIIKNDGRQLYTVLSRILDKPISGNHSKNELSCDQDIISIDKIILDVNSELDELDFGVNMSLF